MIKRKKLPSGLEKGLQKLVEKASRNVGSIQKKLLEELNDRIKSYKDKYIINRYVKAYRQICKERIRAFDEYFEDLVYRIEKF